MALTASFTALGVILAPITWTIVIGTQASPGTHFVLTLAGVLIGPWWASLVAIFVGIIRMGLGVGTIFAFPGGIPGGLLVGLAYKWTSRFKGRLGRYSAAFFEPIGVTLLGGTITLLVIAPLIGSKPLIGLVERSGLYIALLTIWGGWTPGAAIGCVLGYFTLLALDRAGLRFGK